MFPTEGEYVLQGPGENAGVISVGDGWAVAFKMESHNHPSRHRALSGRGDRRGRHHPRHLHDGRAAHRLAGLAALRHARQAAAALPVRRRGRRHRRLRQLPRRAHRGRRGLLRGGLRGQLPHQRDGHRPHARGEPDARDGERSGQPGAAHRLDDRPRRHRRCERARQPGVRRACRGQASQRPGGRPVRGEAAHRGVPRAAR